MSWKNKSWKNQIGKEYVGDHVFEILVPKLSNTKSYKSFQLLANFFQLFVNFFQLLVTFFQLLAIYFPTLKKTIKYFFSISN